MIALQRLNGQAFVLNADFIETLEATPDTVVTLMGGRKIVTKNSVEDVVRKTVKYKQLCNQTVRVLHEEKADISGREPEQS